MKILTNRNACDAKAARACENGRPMAARKDSICFVLFTLVHGYYGAAEGFVDVLRHVRAGEYFGKGLDGFVILVAFLYAKYADDPTDGNLRAC